MKSVQEMYCDAVDASPVSVDWSEGYGEKWDIVFPSADLLDLDEIRRAVCNAGWDLPKTNPFAMGVDGLKVWLAEEGVEFDPEDDRAALLAKVEQEFAASRYFLEEWRDAYRECMEENRERFEPMMSYAWPLPGFRQDAGDAQAMLDLYGGAVAIARYDNEDYIALTGGGMDLSWDVAKGYMLLGYLPPLAVASRLPRMAGMKLTKETAWVLAGALRSAQVVMDRARWAQEDVGRTVVAWVEGPEGIPLGPLNDWLQDRGREEEAGLVRAVLSGVSQ